MTTETGTAPKKATRQGGTPLDFVMPEILNLIIKPRVEHVLNSGVTFTSATNFANAFKAAFPECKASSNTIVNWIKDLGYSFTNTVAINRPTPATSGEYAPEERPSDA